MHEAKVKIKYNQLFGAEERFKKRSLYPIHKKLSFESFPYVDIYDWIISNICFKEGDEVLDAGCGVGYGSLLMAEKQQVQVHGISLSEKEILRATENAKKQLAGDLVKFEVASYDSAFSQKYDQVIAVESLKHSADLQRTLTNLSNSLKPGGQLVIVEDLYQRSDLGIDGQQLTQDYKLTDLFRLNDYYQTLPETQCQIIDLSAHVLPKISWKIESKMWFSKAMHLLNGSKETDIFSILRGGYYLDRLYYKKLMKYQVIIFTAK